MRVPVKFLGFVFWLFSLNCARCQECRIADINYENTEPVEKELYGDGETVKLSCTTGFTGMYRLKCEKGQWKTSIERPCAKKKCSHPGDTPNGDFSLISGSEFVFGATVVYTCKKGFEMTSRISQRTCRAQGWDNTLPICEAVRCPAIRTDEDVSASGNTEEGGYGDVIHFECVSNDKKIDGSSDIHCTETGEWSHPVPKCKEITCTAPNISNGYVDEKRQEYQKDAILKYRCSQGYKPREGIPRCAKFGWTLNPECDEVTCELKSTTFGVKKIKPEGKTIFRAGESVEITCTEKHWIFKTKETIKSFTCQETGEWDYLPVCAEIRCEVPHDQHVYSPGYYFWGDLKFGVKKDYNCMSGYVKTAAEATCTEDGWTPKPLCRVKMCATPNIPNAEIAGDQGTHYNINSRIQYKCRPGFEPEQPVLITCNSQTEWTGIQQCTAKQRLCRDLSVENGFTYSLPSNEEEIFYTCNTGYKPFTGNWWDSVTCSKGSWSEEPRCIREEECGAFPSVHHGKLKQSPRDRGTAEVECDPGFISTQRFIKCINGTWEKPVCEVDVHCGIPPKVENALITSKPEEFYINGSSVTYVCKSSISMKGKNKMFCHNGTWEKTPTCEAKCQKPRKTFMTLLKEKEEYDNKEVLRYKCIEPYNEIPEGEWICENGEWNGTFVCRGKICPLPPYVENGDYTASGYDGSEITEVYYTCQSHYVLNEQQRYYKCEKGKWETPPKCLKPCEITPEIFKGHNVESIREKFYLPHGEKRYNCKYYYSERRWNWRSMTLTCSDGKLDITPCQ
ncbi:hypothetical protein PO909_027197 [Leuciscus waleckii]